VALHPGDRLGKQVGVVQAGEWRLDELSLSPVALGWDYQLASQLGRDLAPIVLTDDMEAEIDTGRASRPGEDVALIDEEHAGIDRELRIAPSQFVAFCPVRCRSPSVEQRARQGAELAEKEREAVHEHLRALVEGRERFEVADDGRHVEGRRVDVPADTLRKLRRGVFPIDARLDLHGMAAAEARKHLDLSLRTLRARGERCVLVIHGKGEHSPQGLGILRGEIAAWLSQGPPGEHVAAFSTARETDGGEGAVYVLLRR